MKAFALVFIGMSLIFVGCGSGRDGGDIPLSAATEAEAMAKARSQYGGDWNRIPETDKKLIVNHFGGDEAAAQTAVRLAAGISQPGPGRIPTQQLPR